MWIEVGTIASFICVKINVDMRLPTIFEIIITLLPRTN